MFQAQWLSYRYNMNVHAQVPDPFILLNQLLLLHVNVKWWLELYDSESMNHHPRLFPNPFDAYQINCISQIIEAANGFSCHGSARDTCPQGRPGVARPSDTSAKNIGRKECRESQRKYVDRSDGSGREH